MRIRIQTINSYFDIEVNDIDKELIYKAIDSNAAIYIEDIYNNKIFLNFLNIVAVIIFDGNNDKKD